MALAQVANLWNSLRYQVLACQEDIVKQHSSYSELVSCLEQRVMQNGGSGKDGSKGSAGKRRVTWEDPHQVEQFTKDAQRMATELSSENRKLRGVHRDVLKAVKELMNTDLLQSRQDRDYDKNPWEDKMNQLKSMVD